MGRCNSNAEPTRRAFSRSGTIATVDSTGRLADKRLIEHAAQIGSLVASTVGPAAYVILQQPVKLAQIIGQLPG
jgi:hypothetical protein